MTTTTKKDLIERIAEETNQSRSAVKRTVQAFLDHVIQELSRGHRIEFRDFGVFEIKDRAPRVARNPRTDQRVRVPARKTVRFKIGKLMQMAVDGELDGQLDGRLDGQMGGHAGRSRTHDMDGELQEARVPRSL